MPRDYSKIESQISEAGFFSEYLPSCFSFDKKIFRYPPNFKCDLIAPVCFTMSRYTENDARRNIFIPEIGSYIVAQQYINQEEIIKELIEFSERTDKSFSPILGKDDSVMRHEQAYDANPTELEELPSNYIDNISLKIRYSAGAKYVLKLDISNCFASFYMHMIPAILLGMEGAETEYNKYIKNDKDETINPIYSKYRKLDEIIRHQNLNRTNGLLTGPLYSKIIAEAILVRIDEELSNYNINFSRYVDDYEVYLYNDEEKQVISIFEKTLKRYGFSLNFEKTELLEFPYYIVENLEKIFSSRVKENLNDAEIMELFNSFFSLEKSGTKGAIRYLLKTIEKKPINTEKPEMYKSYLLTILANNERSLTKACSLLINKKEVLNLDKADIDLIKSLLNYRLRDEHDLEVIWLLYLLIQTGNVNKGDEIVSLIVKSHNELAQIMLLRKSLLLEDHLSLIRSEAKSWILLYELYAANNIDENNFIAKLNINKNLTMYNHFKSKGLHFCNF